MLQLGTFVCVRFSGLSDVTPCVSCSKKICRQHGIKRWPYRKLKSLEKKINTLSDRVEERSEAHLCKLNEQLTQLRGLKSLDNYFADEHRPVESNAQGHTCEDEDDGA